MKAALAAIVLVVSPLWAQDQRYCRAQAVGPRGFAVERIGGRLFCVTDGAGMTVFLATDSGVVALDAPPGLMDSYLAAIREVTAAPVTHLVYSHAHVDHIGGASRFPAGVIRVAHEETARTLARRRDSRRPAPTRTFAQADTLRLGGEMLVLRYHGPTHDPGHILVYAPRERVLVGIDLFNGNAPWLGLGGASDVPGYLAVHDTILTYDFEIFVGGHGRATGTRRDLEIQRAYLADVGRYADSAMATVSYEAASAGAPARAHPYARVLMWRRAQIEQCSTRTLAVWRGRLPGVEEATPSHCEAMLESRRVD